jgi:hypothetical protein
MDPDVLLLLKALDGVTLCCGCNPTRAWDDDDDPQAARVLELQRQYAARAGLDDL